MWSFPLWTLPTLPKEKGVALGMKGVRAHSPFTEEWDVGTAGSGSSFGHCHLELRKTSLDALLPVTIRPCLALSLPTKAQKGRRP